MFEISYPGNIMQSILLISTGSIAFGIIMFGLYRLHIHKKVTKNLRERKNDNFTTFLNHFRNSKTSNEVISVVYNVLSKSTISTEEMPVLPSDDLRKVWGFDDDLNDFIMDLQKKLKISEIRCEGLMVEKLNTVEDLVIILSKKYTEK